ncbi:MAG: hypothetical protein QOG63_1357 [Thermoleophilaceae bacterium]|nr:hypothetical protein [Thermoleophilaceae bacterium]
MSDLAARNEMTTATAAAPGQSRLTKASFNFPTDELDELRALADSRSTTATQVVRQALATELYLQGLVDHGARLLARTGREPMQEIVFSHMRPRA